MGRARRGPHTLHPSLRRILCVSAHPDDNEFVIGSSVARWAREGREVVFCLVTDGGAGTNEHTPSSDGLVPVRERESREAARLLGVKEVVFLGHADGVLEPTLGLRRDLTRVIRRHRPDVVVCGDPTARWYGGEYLNHPDHRAAASATLDAVFPSAEVTPRAGEGHEVLERAVDTPQSPDAVGQHATRGDVAEPLLDG